MSFQNRRLLPVVRHPLSPGVLSLASPVPTRHGVDGASRARERDAADVARGGALRQIGRLHRENSAPAMTKRRGLDGIGCITMSDEPTTPKLQVQIDEDVAQGVYSNLVLLNHTENEFVLDFAFIQPSNGRAKVRSRVISSPRHTKRLLQALQKNLERYEERFGAIDISSDDDPVFH
jgi:hypothetical protein